MNLWFMIKERYVLLSIFLIIMFVSLFLLIAIWKNRSNMPKSLSLNNNYNLYSHNSIINICIGICSFFWI